MAKAESKRTKQAKRNDGKKSKGEAAKAAQIETRFEVRDLMFTIGQDMFLVRCGEVSVGLVCGQPTAPRVELAWTEGSAGLKDLKKSLLQALLELEHLE